MSASRRRLVDSFLSLVGINSVLAGLSFFTTLMLANRMGREHFGDLAYALAIGAYCMTIAFCGVDQTQVRDLVQNPGRFADHVSAGILLRLVMLAVAFAGIFMVHSFAADSNRLTAAGVVIVVAEGVKSLGLYPAYDAWGEMKRHALYLLVERCLYFGGLWTILLFFRDEVSLGSVAGFFAVSTVLGLLLQYRWALGRVRLNFNRGTLLAAFSLFRHNVWVWGAVLATLSMGGLSKIVLKHVSGSGQLGGYAVAWQIVLLGSLVFSQIGRIANPLMAGMTMPAVAPALRLAFVCKYLAFSALAGSAIGLPAILFPEMLLQALRPEYAAVAETLRILGIYVIIIAAGQVAPQYLIAVRKERIYAVIVMLSGGLGLLLNILLIPLGAARGAALAVVFSHGIAIAACSALMIHHLLSQGRGEPEAVRIDGVLGLK